MNTLSQFDTMTLGVLILVANEPQSRHIDLFMQSKRIRMKRLHCRLHELQKGIFFAMFVLRILRSVL